MYIVMIKVPNVFASHFLGETKFISQTTLFYYQQKIPSLLDYFIYV